MKFKSLAVVAILSVFSNYSFGQSTFSQITSLFQTNCTIGCHNASDNSGNLNLTGTNSEVYNRIVNAVPTNPAAAAKGHKLIRPGYPDRSFMYRKCNAGLYPNDGLTGANEGNTMPDSYPQGQLENQQIELIRQWIYKGAPLTGNVVDTSLINEYYTVGGINSIPTPPPVPTEAGAFQLHLGKIFLAPQSEAEYFIKYDLELPENIQVNRIEMVMSPQSHHFLLYKFLPGQDASFDDGLRLQNPTNANGSSGASSTMINAWQISFDTNLPDGTAYIWPTGSVLDMNFHTKNYSLDSVLAAEVYFNVYTVPNTQPMEVMYSDLVTDVNIFIPADNAPHTFTQADYTTSATRYWNLWQLTSHTHKYGTDFDIYKRNANGTQGDQIYEGWYNTDYTFNQGYYSFSHPPVRQFSPLEQINPRDGLIQKATFRNSGNSLVYFGLTTNDEMKLYYVQYTLGDLINPTGIETSSSSSFSIFPNPTENSFTIQFNLESENNVEIMLSDISGRTIMQKNFGKLSSGNQNISIDTELSDGIYWVNVISNQGTSIQKICIQH
jgi:hypothetical protein